MISRRTLRMFAKALLGALLFAQTALVFAACGSAWRAPALVIALADQEVDSTNCHEQGGNANLCLAHCLGEDQSLDKPLVKVPALSAVPVFYVPAVLVLPHEACVLRCLAVPHAAGPPPRILFQSFLL